MLLRIPQDVLSSSALTITCPGSTYALGVGRVLLGVKDSAVSGCMIGRTEVAVLSWLAVHNVTQGGDLPGGDQRNSIGEVHLVGDGGTPQVLSESGNHVCQLDLGRRSQGLRQGRHDTGVPPPGSGLANDITPLEVIAAIRVVLPTADGTKDKRIHEVNGILGHHVRRLDHLIKGLIVYLRRPLPVEDVVRSAYDQRIAADVGQQWIGSVDDVQWGGSSRLLLVARVAFVEHEIVSHFPGQSATSGLELSLVRVGYAKELPAHACMVVTGLHSVIEAGSWSLDVVVGAAANLLEILLWGFPLVPIDTTTGLTGARRRFPLALREPWAGTNLRVVKVLLVLVVGVAHESVGRLKVGNTWPVQHVDPVYFCGFTQYSSPEVVGLSLEEVASSHGVSGGAFIPLAPVPSLYGLWHFPEGIGCNDAHLL